MLKMLRRLSFLLRRSRLDADLREEMETHRTLRRARLEADGATADEADRASRYGFGNATLAREDARRLWGASWLEGVWQDVRVSLRTFVKRPLVWTAAVVSLALGIGVNTAVFSLFDQVLLRRLPVPDPEAIVSITASGPRSGSRSTSNAGGPEAVFSYPLVRDLERLENTGLAAIAAYRSIAVNLAHAGETTPGQGLLVSGGYFPAMGVAPVAGRLLGPGDDRVPGGHPVVVVGYDYWTDSLGGDPAIVGTTLVVNGHALEVVGVAPDGFNGTVIQASQPDVFVPLAMADPIRPRWSGTEVRDDHWLYVSARLSPGVTREQAEALLAPRFTVLTRDIEFPALRSGLGETAREAFLARRVHLEDGGYGRGGNRDAIRTALLLVFAVTGLVLLIACANVANLMLARASDRQAEIALRLAIGAAPRRVVRALLTEAVLLGLIAGAAALVVAWATIDVLLALAPLDGGRPFEFVLNARVLGVAFAVGLGTGVLFGLWPAVRGVRAALARGLGMQSGRVSGSSAVVRSRGVLAAVQVTLATALLALAGLCLTSVSNIARAELGIRRDGLLTFGLSPSLNGYTPERSRALFDRVEAAVRALPGVRAVSTTTVPILSNSDFRQNLTVEGFDAQPGADTHASRASIGPDYFRTLGIPLRAGREFTREDVEGAPKVAIVNDAFARKFNLGDAVIGRRIGLGQGSSTPLDIEVVGLVADAAYSRVRDTPPPQFFLPNRQQDAGALTLHFYVRTEAAALTMGDVRPLVGSLAPSLPIAGLRTMDEQIALETRGDRTVALFASIFAALATLLAGVGLYAVLAYAVALRQREIGIRVALGASIGHVVRTVLRQLTGITVVGVVAGTAAVLVAGRLGRALLFGVEGVQVPVIGATIALVLLMAAAAAALPLRRAVSVDPVIVLRSE